MEPIEYAQTYNSTERLRFLGLGVVLGALVIGAAKFWFFPWAARFSTAAPCSTVLGISAGALLRYGLFVAVPLSGALVAGLGFGRSGIAILRESQFPPVGAKVFRPTRIIRGNAARRVGYVRLAAFIPFLALAIWGFIQAGRLSDQNAASKCAANNSFKPNPLRGSA